MKNSLCLFCFILINIISLKAQTLRNTVALNGNWRFITDLTNAGQAKQWLNGLPANAVAVTVPHTWNVMKELEDYSGLAWYEKSFTPPAQYRNKQLRLQFEAIYHDAIIYFVDLGKVHLWHFNGEDGSANYKARIHGITDIYFNKKSSYYVFKQLASPILITNVKKLNETTVQVTIQNKDQLPSYTVRDFMVTWPNSKNKQTQQKLPTLKPGETFIFTLDDMNTRAGFDICTPAGYRVISYPFVH